MNSKVKGFRCRLQCKRGSYQEKPLKHTVKSPKVSVTFKLDSFDEHLKIETGIKVPYASSKAKTIQSIKISKLRSIHNVTSSKEFHKPIIQEPIQESDNNKEIYKLDEAKVDKSKESSDILGSTRSSSYTIWSKAKNQAIQIKPNNNQVCQSIKLPQKKNIKNRSVPTSPNSGKSKAKYQLDMFKNNNSKQKYLMKLQEEQIIKESAEESMLRDYWLKKEEIEEKYQKLFADLKREEEQEISMKIKKLKNTNKNSAGEFLDILINLNDYYTTTTNLLQQQRIIEIEQLLTEYKEIVL